MQGAWTRWSSKYAMGAALLLAVTGRVVAGGDDSNPGLLGRLFRVGSGSASGSGSPATPPAQQPASLPYGGSYGNSLPPGGTSGGPAMPLASPFGGLPETPRLPADGGPGQRLTPRSRVSNAVTTADPLLTRFALGKSNDGSSFGMFLQIFADGTVVDSEGVHHIRPADLKPIVDTVQSGDLYRLRGHCGAPSTDFIEYVHLVIYERRFGRLQAHSFSYSGNPQGCDHAIRHLHTALENLQAKLSRQPGAESPGTASAAPASPGSDGRDAGADIGIGALPLQRGPGRALLPEPATGHARHVAGRRGHPPDSGRLGPLISVSVPNAPQGRSGVARGASPRTACLGLLCAGQTEWRLGIPSRDREKGDASGRTSGPLARRAGRFGSPSIPIGRDGELARAFPNRPLNWAEDSSPGGPAHPARSRRHRRPTGPAAGRNLFTDVIRTHRTS